MMTSIKSWLKWEEEQSAKGNGIAVEIKSFLKAKPQFLIGGFKDVAENDDTIHPSPRKLIAA